MKTEKEEWKPVPSFEEYYQVSNRGRVYILPRIDTIGRKKRGKMMKLKLKSNGMCVASFQVADRRWGTHVGMLVLTAFNRSPKKGEICYHIDRDRENNHLDNLEWWTWNELNRDEAGKFPLLINASD